MFQQLTIPLFQEPEFLETKIEWFDKISESSQIEDVPPIILKIIEDRECVIVLSISGGKDSQAAQAFILHLKELYGWQNKIYAIHADLGRADWKFTQPFVKKQCADAGLDLVIVKADDDLLTIIFKRWLKIIRDRKKVPHFPSAAARYCTKASKTQPTDKYLRCHNLVINVMGIRAQESRTRAKKPVVSLRTSLCSEKFAVKFCELDTKKVKKYWLPVEEAWRLWNETGRKHRLAIDWNAIHSWKVEKVWEWCGTSLQEWERRRKLTDEEALLGWSANPVYVIGLNGNERMSCAFCFLAGENDLVNAIAFNPNTFDWLVQNEQESGWDFQEKKPLRRFAKYRVELIEGLSQEESEILIALYQKPMPEEELEEFMPLKSIHPALDLLSSKRLILCDEGKYRINFDYLTLEEKDVEIERLHPHFG